MKQVPIGNGSAHKSSENTNLKKHTQVTKAPKIVANKSRSFGEEISKISSINGDIYYDCSIIITEEKKSLVSPSSPSKNFFGFITKGLDEIFHYLKQKLFK